MIFVNKLLYNLLFLLFIYYFNFCFEETADWLVVAKIIINFSIVNVHQGIFLRLIMSCFENDSISICWLSLKIVFICFDKILVGWPKCQRSLSIMHQRSLLFFWKLTKLNEFVVKLERLDIILFQELDALIKVEWCYVSEVKITKQYFYIMTFPAVLCHIWTSFMDEWIFENIKNLISSLLFKVTCLSLSTF